MRENVSVDAAENSAAEQGSNDQRQKSDPQQSRHTIGAHPRGLDCQFAIIDKLLRLDLGLFQSIDLVVDRFERFRIGGSEILAAGAIGDRPQGLFIDVDVDVLHHDLSIACATNGETGLGLWFPRRWHKP